MTLKYHNIESWKKTLLAHCYGDISKAIEDTKQSIEKFKSAKNKTEKVLERIEMLKTILNDFEEAYNEQNTRSHMRTLSR